ncbi:MAG: hypothetical protein R3B13_34530 [Polyangiaceae bacterium]
MNTRVGLLGAIGILSLVGMAGACSSDDSSGGGGSGGSGAGGTGGFAATGNVGATGGTGNVGASGGTGGGGGSDPCAADDNNALTTVGCNGASIGAQADNAYGGKCTPDANFGQGTCTDPTNICDAFDETLGGICVVECTSGGTYVSTGGCPAGSRCFDFGTVAFCYPDCADENDCGTGVCDSEGACSSPFPPDDAGTGDGGVSDASAD